MVHYGQWMIKMQLGLLIVIWSSVSLNLLYFIYLFKWIIQMLISVLKTRRRTEPTAAWTAGHTLRKKVSPRVKRKKRARASAAIRLGTNWVAEFQVADKNIKQHVWGNTAVFLQGPKSEGCLSDGKSAGHNLTSANTCRTKEFFSSKCADRFTNIALRLPWTINQNNCSLRTRPTKANISLVELLVRILCSIISCVGRKVLINAWKFGRFVNTLPLFLTQDDSDITSDEECGLTQDEIQAFLEQNRSFYSNRHQYRQLLKEKFTNYCRSTEEGKPVCGKRFASTSVK